MWRAVRGTSFLLLVILLPSVWWETSLYSLWGRQEGATPLSPERIRETLLNGNESQRRELAKKLRLTYPWWGRGDPGTGEPFTDFESIKVTHVRLLPRGHQAAIVAKATQSSEHCFLIIVTRPEAGLWTYVDTLPLWSKHSEPNIYFKSLIEPGIDEIVVRDLTVDSGTGIYQTNMRIFRLDRGRLEIVFDEPERVTFWVPTGNGTSPSYNTEQAEDNQFSFVDVEQGEPSASVKQVLEKRVIRDHKTTIVEWWVYFWSPEIGRFVGVRTSR